MQVEVSYSRKASPPGEFSSIGVGGAVRFEVPEGQNVAESFKFELDKLRLLVDDELSLLTLKETQEVVAAPAQAVPPPPPPPPSMVVAQTPQPSQRTETPGTPDISTIKPGEKVYYDRVYVLDSEIKKGQNPPYRKYAQLRLGKDGPHGIPGHYVNARILDPELSSLVGNFIYNPQSGQEEPEIYIHRGMYVDVWGVFQPWRTDASKFDLKIDALRVVS